MKNGVGGLVVSVFRVRPPVGSLALHVLLLFMCRSFYVFVMYDDDPITTLSLNTTANDVRRQR